LGQPAQLLPLMRPYYVVVLLSMIPLIVVNTLRQFTDGITDTHVSMWVLTGGNLLNIVGNWMLIYGTCGMPEWGLFGAGVSTLLSRVVMAVVYIAVFCRMKKYKGYFRGFIEESVNRRDMLAVCRTSSPVAMQMGMETGIFTVASVMIGWLGAEYLASYQVILILGTIGFMVYYSFGAGMAIKISNCAGVGDVRQIRLSARAGYHIILLSALVACLVFFFAGRYIIMLFTSDARVIAISTTLIIPLLLYQLGDATQVAYANALRGISCVMPVMKYAFIAYVLVGLPLNYLFGFTFHGGIVGIYLSFFVALLLAGILYMQRFYRQLRQM
jgi:MATE family multidrug resistance protein